MWSICQGCCTNTVSALCQHPKSDYQIFIRTIDAEALLACIPNSGKVTTLCLCGWTRFTCSFHEKNSPVSEISKIQNIRNFLWPLSHIGSKSGNATPLREKNLQLSLFSHEEAIGRSPIALTITFPHEHFRLLGSFWPFLIGLYLLTALVCNFPGQLHSSIPLVPKCCDWHQILATWPSIPFWTICFWTCQLSSTCVQTLSLQPVQGIRLSSRQNYARLGLRGLWKHSLS
jgi:hypothetical protein